MDTLLLILQLVMGALGLHFGAGWLVDGSSRVAAGFGVRPLVVGATVVAAGTSAPELMVGVTSVLQGAPDLGVGNVVGSNIANIGLVLGLSALIKPLPLERSMVLRMMPAVMLSAVLLAALPLVPPVYVLTRWKAGLLLLAMGLILWSLISGGRSDAARPHGSRGWHSLLALIGLCALLLGGKLLVDGAAGVAQMLRVPELVVGLTLLAVGTSLPELATAIASLRRERSISVGDLLGSNIYNICLVLAVVALVSPLSIDARVAHFDNAVMLAFTGVLAAMALLGGGIGRAGGAALVGAYGLYVANLFAGWV